jgi:hypothetical protein
MVDESEGWHSRVLEGSGSEQQAEAHYEQLLLFVLPWRRDQA